METISATNTGGHSGWSGLAWVAATVFQNDVPRRGHGPGPTGGLGVVPGGPAPGERVQVEHEHPERRGRDQQPQQPPATLSPRTVPPGARVARVIARTARAPDQEQPGDPYGAGEPRPAAAAAAHLSARARSQAQKAAAQNSASVYGHEREHRGGGEQPGHRGDRAAQSGQGRGRQVGADRGDDHAGEVDRAARAPARAAAAAAARGRTPSGCRRPGRGSRSMARLVKCSTSHWSTMSARLRPW